MIPATILLRVSERHQKPHLRDQERVCREWAEENGYEVVMVRSCVAPVWSKKWKDFIEKTVLAVKLVDCGTIIAESSLRVQKSKNWSTSNPYPRLSRKELIEMYSRFPGLVLKFVAEDDYTSEHSLQIKRGNPGRPIKKSTAKRLAKQFRDQGFSYGKIQRELSIKGFEISR